MADNDVKQDKSADASSDEIMNILELASMLKVSRAKVDEMVDKKLVPYFKIGKRVRFHKGTVIGHFAAQAGSVETSGQQA